MLLLCISGGGIFLLLAWGGGYSETKGHNTMKRFTDTMKWEDPWFMELSAKHKLLWLYLVDKCNNAGVWKVNLRVVSMFLNETITIEDILSFNDDLKVRVHLFASNTSLLIKEFVKFQIMDINALDEKAKLTNLQKNCLAEIVQYLEDETLTLDDFNVLTGKLQVVYALLTGIGKGKGKGKGKDKGIDKIVHGEYKRVKLTDVEYQRLLKKYGGTALDSAIIELDLHIEGKGTDPYDSHCAAMQKWVFDAVARKGGGQKRYDPSANL